MGADANAVIEVEWGPSHWVPLASFHFYDRNYEVFGELNGVRRCWRVGPGGSGDVTKEIPDPLVVEPRGLPRDAASHTFDFAHQEDTVPFRPTWLTRHEVEAVDRQITRLHGASAGGQTWPAIVACMRATAQRTRLVFWTDQA